MRFLSKSQAGILLAFGSLLAILLAPNIASAASLSSSLCKAQLQVKLDISAAASTPAIVDGNQSTIGAGEASQEASQLLSDPAPSICSGHPNSSLTLTLNKVSKLIKQGKTSQADKLLKAAEQAEKKVAKNSSHKFQTKSLKVAADSPCPDQMGHISTRNQIVSDFLGIAFAAGQAKDLALSSEAIEYASEAFDSWATSSANPAQTVGDWLAVEHAANAIGADSARDYAHAQAEARAKADLEQVIKLDECVAKKGEFQCAVKKLSTNMLIGADVGTHEDDALKFSKAYKARSKGVAAKGCEMWDFTLHFNAIYDDGAMSIDYNAGRFKVDREQGTVTTVTSGAPSPAGYEMVIHDGTASCTGYRDDGTLLVLPGTIKGGTYHYHFDGSSTSASIQVIPISDDADITIDIPIHGPDEVGCALAATLAKGFILAPFRVGFPIDFTADPSQKTASYSFQDDTGSITAQITQVPVVAP